MTPTMTAATIIIAVLLLKQHPYNSIGNSKK